MSTLLSNLPSAIGVGSTDQMVINQGTVPATKKVSVSLLSQFILGQAFAINAQTGTSYVAALTDAIQTLIQMNNAAANAVTISKFATIPWPLGSCLLMYQKGAGVSSFLADSGVTFLTSSSSACRVQNSIIAAINVAQDTWLICGDCF